MKVLKKDYRENLKNLKYCLEGIKVTIEPGTFYTDLDKSIRAIHAMRIYADRLEAQIEQMKAEGQN